MTGEEAIGTHIAKTTAIALMASEVMMLLYELRWLIVVTFALVLVDLRFGNRESREKKVEIRVSRAIRRTCNKMVDYICWLIVGGLLGLAMRDAYGWSEVTTAASALALCWLCELNSIYGHYCELYHVKKRFDLYHIFLSLIGRTGEAIKDAEMKDNGNEDN